jgi:hypothetical protein
MIDSAWVPSGLPSASTLGTDAHQEAAMNEQRDATRYELTRSQILSLRAAEDVTIACDRGLVWVTANGRLDDYWLPSGDTLSIRRGGRVVIEAAQPSAIAVTRSAAKPYGALLRAGGRALRHAFAGWPRGARRDAQLCTGERA